MNIIFILLVCIVVLLFVLLFILFKNNPRKQFREQYEALARVSEMLIKEELARSRTEAAQGARDLRLELLQQVSAFDKGITEHINAASEMQYRQLHQFSEQLYKLTQANAERFALFQSQVDSHNGESRKVMQEQLLQFRNGLDMALGDYKAKLRENFSDFGQRQGLHYTHTAEQLADIKRALEASIRTLQEANERKLEEMRRTVDEKLNETLEKRLGESFRLVSERLEAVHRGLGDMQHLALSVGDLKKVMSNVKSRGVLGEYQLQNLLEDLLTREQYARNVKTRPGSGANVEFAIKMPNGPRAERSLWLPVDAKFPKEDYELLLLAYDEGQPERIEQCRKAFSTSIRKHAQDIRDRYIEPPYTTEYGIMFLPFESLYAEVLRIPGLFERLQKEYKIVITGPATLSALLNSLQMGFRTLAIEQRSAEVWDLLAAVKVEFSQFGNLLDKTRKKLDEAANVIDSAGQRTRVLQRKLNQVAAPGGEQGRAMLPGDDIDQETEA